MFCSRPGGGGGGGGGGESYPTFNVLNNNVRLRYCGGVLK